MSKQEETAGEISMSEHARRWYRKHPDDNPTACVEGLALEGIQVSKHVASNIKYGKGHPKAHTNGHVVKARPARAAIPTVVVEGYQGNEPTQEEIADIARFCHDHGGIKRTRRLLDAFSKKLRQYKKEAAALHEALELV